MSGRATAAGSRSPLRAAARRPRRAGATRTSVAPRRPRHSSPVSPGYAPYAPSLASDAVGQTFSANAVRVGDFVSAGRIDVKRRWRAQARARRPAGRRPDAAATTAQLTQSGSRLPAAEALQTAVAAVGQRVRPALNVAPSLCDRFGDVLLGLHRHLYFPARRAKDRRMAHSLKARSKTSVLDGFGRRRRRQR